MSPLKPMVPSKYPVTITLPAASKATPSAS